MIACAHVHNGPGDVCLSLRPTAKLGRLLTPADTEADEDAFVSAMELRSKGIFGRTCNLLLRLWFGEYSRVRYANDIFLTVGPMVRICSLLDLGDGGVYT